MRRDTTCYVVPRTANTGRPCLESAQCKPIIGCESKRPRPGRPACREMLTLRVRLSGLEVSFNEFVTLPSSLASERCRRELTCYRFCQWPTKKKKRPSGMKV